MVENGEQSFEDRFRQMAEHLDEVFILWEGSEVEVLYVSPAIVDVIGIDEATFRDPVARVAYIHPDDRALLAAPQAPVKEFRILRPDGEERWIRSRSSVIATPDGQPDRGVATLTDVTDQKLAELAAVAARAEAEAANQAKSEFLSRMSHELRTPLNAILGFGQLLALDELSADQRDAVEHIVRAGAHLLELVDEVLDISQVEAGQLRLSMEPVRVRDVVDEAVGMLQPLADQRHVRLVVADAGLDPHVVADRQRLRQVAVNLLVNAIKYNREGGRARIGIDAPRADRVRLSVTDTGRGIADADLGRLFQPFERLSAEQSGVAGTGLGLALTKALVAAMDGEIGVTSRLGEGTTFWVDLETVDAPVDAGPAARPAPAALPAPDEGVHRRVLYVEDNLSNVRLMEKVFEHRPAAELEVAGTGAVAVALALAQRPDLVLLDLHLPDMTGEDVLRALRADPRTAATPIVVVTADASPGRGDGLVAAGATGFLTKPFDLPELLRVIDGLG